MNVSNFARAGTAIIGGVFFFVALSAGANAVPSSFNVTTTIAASCSMTAAAPGNLTPTYSMPTDSGDGAKTALNTFCVGTAPSVTFTDAYNSGSNVFAMTDAGGANLYYQLSNNATCDGTGADNPINENAPVSLGSGANSLNICAAVLTDGSNDGAPAGTYSDTVTYSMTP